MLDIIDSLWYINGEARKCFFNGGFLKMAKTLEKKEKKEKNAKKVTKDTKKKKVKDRKSTRLNSSHMA